MLQVTKNNKPPKNFQKFEQYLRKQVYLGYPANAAFDYSPFAFLLKYPLNNVGDPFIDTTFKISSREYEKKVLRFFAKIYRIPNESFWGYITNGGTEGNLYGLFLARELHPSGTLYFSQDSHYSIPKIARILKLSHTIIPSLPNGEMNYQKLQKALSCQKKGSAIINLNIGTTMKGAIDNLKSILAILKANKIPYYIHCDAALFGMMLPFIKNAPKIDFTNSIDSIAISCHKFIGSPIPCGVVLTKKKYVKKIEKKIEYIGSNDTTISGSRNGVTPVLIWHAINMKMKKNFKKEVEDCLKRAFYLAENLKIMHYPYLLNPYSNIVAFKKPPLQLIKKWQLATQNDISHVVVMPHVTYEKINKFLADLQSSL